MASDEMPGAAFTHTVRGFFGEELTIVAYAPEDGEDGGAVQFLIKGEDGETASAHISSPAEREALARAWMESRRIADGPVAEQYDPLHDLAVLLVASVHDDRPGPAGVRAASLRLREGLMVDHGMTASEAEARIRAAVPHG